jgi:hypothetical protein
MASQSAKWVLPVLTSALIGCAELEGDVGADGVVDDAALTSDNGLPTVNGLAVVNGLPTVNGIPTVNGLCIANGLATTTGLASTSGLMTTIPGRKQVEYIVRCALPPTASITKKDQYGKSYTFTGLLGLAPAWQSGACDTNCQESVSACLLAHVNTSAIHVPLWIVSGHPSVGWGQDPEFPNHEGSFFGNVFMMGAHGTDPAKAPMYYCTGPKYNVNAPSGRIGSSQTNPPYVDPWGSNASCNDVSRCAAADYPNGSHGFKSCNGWNNVVTVWRQSTPTTTTSTIGSGGIGKGFKWR